MELKHEIEDLKSAEVGLTGTQAGGMGTMAAAQAGLMGPVIAGAIGLVVGIFIGFAAPRN